MIFRKPLELQTCKMFLKIGAKVILYNNLIYYSILYCGHKHTHTFGVPSLELLHRRYIHANQYNFICTDVLVVRKLKKVKRSISKIRKKKKKFEPDRKTRKIIYIIVSGNGAAFL